LAINTRSSNMKEPPIQAYLERAAKDFDDHWQANLIKEACLASAGQGSSCASRMRRRGQSFSICASFL
jgi:hypothetical protein